MKFTESGSVSLSVTEDENTLLFRVVDTGIGFDDTVKVSTGVQV